MKQCNDDNLGFSIIVCAFNSVLRIRDTLRFLRQLKIPEGYKAELILVDNNSTDATINVCVGLWTEIESLIPLRVVRAKRQGLQFARVEGVKSASYSIGVFCDDDNWLQSDYLERVSRWFQTEPSVGAVGGLGIVASDVEIPSWFTDVREAYAVGPQLSKTGDATLRKYLWGAGLAFRVGPLKAALKAGIEPLVSDRTGSNLGSGGDGEICAWLILLGFRLMYDQELVYKHYMPKTRLTLDYFRDLASTPQSGSWVAYSRFLNVILSLRYGRTSSISGLSKSFGQGFLCLCALILTPKEFYLIAIIYFKILLVKRDRDRFNKVARLDT